MNTHMFDKVLPGFEEAFGQNKSVQLLLSTLSQGNIHTSSSGLEGTQAVRIEIQILN